MAAATPPSPVAEVDDELEGTDLSRILTLSDGIFAFAMTLIALSLAVPVFTDSAGRAIPSDSVTSGQLWSGLAGDLPVFATYLFGFFIIAYWWEIHRRLFAHLKRWDRRIIWANLAFLLEIAVTPFLVSVYTRYGNLEPAIIVYAGAQGLAGAFLVILWHHATSGRRFVAPDLDPTLIARYRTRLLVTVAIFALSMGVAVVSVPVAQYTWVAVFVYSAVSTRRQRQRRAPRAPAPPVTAGERPAVASPP